MISLTCVKAKEKNSQILETIPSDNTTQYLKAFQNQTQLAQQQSNFFPAPKSPPTPSSSITTNLLSTETIGTAADTTNKSIENVSPYFDDDNSYNDGDSDDDDKITFNVVQLLKTTTYSIDSIESNSSDKTKQFNLPPTQSIPIQQNFHTNNIQYDKASNRSGKDSIIRAALRVAARQGLEAMVELYDKKEPNLLKKGEF